MKITTIFKMSKMTVLIASTSLISSLMAAETNVNTDSVFSNAGEKLASLKYKEAASAFDLVAQNAKTRKLKMEAVYYSSLSQYLLAGKNTVTLAKVQKKIDSLLIVAEPEDKVYLRALLLKSYTTYKMGDKPKAERQFLDARLRVSSDENLRAPWFCKEILSLTGATSSADCEKKLDSAFPEGLKSAVSLTVSKNTQSSKKEETKDAVVAKDSKKKVTEEKEVSEGDSKEKATKSTKNSKKEDSKEKAKKEKNTKDEADDSAVDVKKGQYIIQVGAFSTKANANKRIDDMDLKGKKVWIEKRGKAYLVRVGPFEDKDDAKSFGAKKLKKYDHAILKQ